MNRYPQLSDTEKARILCRLFPDQIPVLLEFIVQQTAVFLVNPARFKSQHGKLSFSFDRLLLSAKRGQCFISLSDGYTACYPAQLLTVKIKPAHQRFAIVGKLLVMVYPPCHQVKYQTFHNQNQFDTKSGSSQDLYHKTF